MKSVEWLGDRLRLIDQTKLPGALTFLDCRTPDDVAEAIVALRVRGAPAIGVAAGYGVALAGLNSGANVLSQWWRDVDAAIESLRRTRPTAVNLAHALDRVRQAAVPAASIADGNQRIVQAAHTLANEDLQANHDIAKHGVGLISDAANVLTHCNTGALATTEHGTALGIIRTAHEQGRRIHVWVDETRPALQGSRLTAWELLAEGIPHTIVADGAAASLMGTGKVDVVVVGADRVVANGDVANKVGTYGLAVLAHAHGIPFFVAAPTSTIDLSVKSGEEIPIEERSPDEIRRIAGLAVAPADSPAFNPAFDVTPSGLIAAIVTDKGIARPPYEQSLLELARGSVAAIG